MILGSLSSVGTTLITTGLCRLYTRRGWRTAPLKAQNISSNAAVCSGGEIGVSLPKEYTPYTTLRIRAYEHLPDVLEASLDIHRVDQIIANVN